VRADIRAELAKNTASARLHRMGTRCFSAEGPIQGRALQLNRSRTVEQSFGESEASNAQVRSDRLCNGRDDLWIDAGGRSILRSQLPRLPRERR
jgi:hypothetical protein